LKMIKKFLVLFTLISACSVVYSLLADEPDRMITSNRTSMSHETPEQHAARMRWWREARFGMFIHWGLYSVPAGTWRGQRVDGIGEWIMNKGKIPVEDYAQFASDFNPVKFDADAWVRLAKQAGMKYIVITAKHHDGFAMFKSAASPFNIVDATRFKRDPLQELSRACRYHGIKLGFYYSQAQDWHHRGGAAMGGHWDPAAQDGDMTEYLTRIAVPQVRELLSNYGPVAVLWWDTPTDMTQERAELLAPLLELQPHIIINNRLGGIYRGDIETPENKIPATGYPRDWEACMTMNETWGYKSYDHEWKTPEMLVRNLIDIASKGGNYLLNVGPTCDGEIPAASVERLRAIGAWMEVNAESIYGTAASPFKRLTWGRATQKPGLLYLNVFYWPKNGDLVVPMRSGAKRAYLLGAQAESLPSIMSTDGLHIRVPALAPNPISSVVVLEGVGQIDPLPPAPIAADAGDLFKLDCDAAALFGGDIRIEGSVDLSLVNWTSPDSFPQWEVQIDRPGRYEASAICLVPTGQSGSSFELTVGTDRLEVKTQQVPEFRRVEFGTIRVSRSGPAIVRLKPTQIARGEFLRLRTLTLKRVGE
jgi:alpha-L-fucosidase